MNTPGRLPNATGRLLHYRATPLAALNAGVTAQDGRHIEIGKPSGLWVSVEGPDDWEAWCLTESYGLAGLSVKHQVLLTPDARIKRISDTAEFDIFTRQYRRQSSSSHGWKRESGLIDWAKVAEAYQGVIIAPYLWNRRLGGRESFWYYGWDCASGCIWDTAAIASFTPAADA